MPNKKLSIDQGAVTPFQRMATSMGWYRRRLAALGEAFGFTTAMPIEKFTTKQYRALMHGTGDTLTPASAATAYAARRLQAGLDTTTRLYDGAPHAFFNSPARPPAPQATLDLVAWLEALPR